MKYKFHASITVAVLFSDEDFTRIFNNFQNSYDYDLRAATRCGGWLYGEKVARVWNEEQDTKEEIRTELTSRRIDMILKSLEMDYSEPARELKANVEEILSHLQVTTSDVNNELNVNHHQSEEDLN